jgi:hypothetical protein
MGHTNVQGTWPMFSFQSAVLILRRALQLARAGRSHHCKSMHLNTAQDWHLVQ